MPVGATYKINGWANEVVSFNYQLKVVVCTCSITYAIPAEVVARLIRFNSHDYPQHYASTYCPNGHNWHYTGESPEAKTARERAEKAERALQWTQDELNTTKKTLKRTEKRIHAGVCPDCNRTFQNVARHMTTKHKQPA